MQAGSPESSRRRIGHADEYQLLVARRQLHARPNRYDGRHLLLACTPHGSRAPAHPPARARRVACAPATRCLNVCGSPKPLHLGRPGAHRRGVARRVRLRRPCDEPGGGQWRGSRARAAVRQRRRRRHRLRGVRVGARGRQRAARAPPEATPAAGQRRHHLRPRRAARRGDRRRAAGGVPGHVSRARGGRRRRRRAHHAADGEAAALAAEGTTAAGGGGGARQRAVRRRGRHHRPRASRRDGERGDCRPATLIDALARPRQHHGVARGRATPSRPPTTRSSSRAPAPARRAGRRRRRRAPRPRASRWSRPGASARQQTHADTYPYLPTSRARAGVARARRGPRASWRHESGTMPAPLHTLPPPKRSRRRRARRRAC